MRGDKPSLQLAPSGEGMEQMATTHTDGSWELYIINYLISHCNTGGLGQTDEEISGSELEDGNHGYALVPVVKSKKERRRGKQEEKQNTDNALLNHCNEMAH